MINYNKEKMRKAKYPLYMDGKFQAKNLFKTDWQTILFILFIIYIVWAFKVDTESCKQVVEEPKEFCSEWCDISYCNQAEVQTDGFEIEYGFPES